MLSPDSLDRTRTKPLAQLAERQDSEKLCGSAKEDFHSNFSTILGLACYASCSEDSHNSVLTFNIVVWYGNLGVKGKAKLARIVGVAGKITGGKQDSLSDICLTARILDDANTPSFLSFRNSGRADDTKWRLPGGLYKNL